MAYNTQCCHDNEFNNLKIVEQLVNLRMELAQLLGFKNYAEYVLKKRMAEHSENVYKLLNDCWRLIHRLPSGSRRNPCPGSRTGRRGLRADAVGLLLLCGKVEKPEIQSG